MAKRKSEAAKLEKNPAAVALGKLGGKARAEALSRKELSAIGKQGAQARMKALTAAQRTAIAKKAVAAREAKRREGR